MSWVLLLFVMARGGVDIEQVPMESETVCLNAKARLEAQGSVKHVEGVRAECVPVRDER